MTASDVAALAIAVVGGVSIFGVLGLLAFSWWREICTSREIARRKRHNKRGGAK